MKSWLSSLALFFTSSICAQEVRLTIPEEVLISSGLDAAFVARFALFIGMLLIGTVLLAKVFKRLFKLPVIAGQIIAGIVLGPSLLNIKGLPLFAYPLQLLDMATGQSYALSASDLYVFFVLLISSALTVSYLLWVAGHETDVKDILKVGTTATFAGLAGAIIPIGMVAAYLVYFLTGYSLAASIGIGIIFSATSVSIPVAMLVAQNKMDLRSSKATLGAAIIDDIAAVIILSVYTIALQAGVFGSVEGITFSSHTSDLGSALFAMVLTLIILFVVGMYCVRPFLAWINNRYLYHLLVPMATGIMLLFFAGAELLGGLAGITGAYFAGLFHRMGDKRHHAERVISPYVNMFLLPLFLGSIGLQLDLSILTLNQWGIVVIMLIIAIASKLIGCYMATISSNMFGNKKKQLWTTVEGYLFGSAMVARGEVGLVIATILQGMHIITQEQYVISVVVIVLTTIAAPIMLAWGFDHLDADKASGNQDYVFDLGIFPVIGTNQMFNIITWRIESEKRFNTSVRFSEGQKIVNLEGQNVKIILRHGIGIRFRGDRQKIEEIIHLVKHDLQAELLRLPSS